MLNKMLNNLCLWDLSRHLLDLTCGLYRKRISFLKDTGLFRDNPSVLDIGCGTGLFAGITRGRYVGIDMDSRSIERAKKKRYKEEKIFRCINLSVLRKEKAVFDVILIADVLHHLDNEGCIALLKASSEIAGKYLISLEGMLKKDTSVMEKWFMKHDQGRYFRYLDDFNKLFPAGGYKIMENHDIPLGYLSAHLTICCKVNL